MFLLNKMINHSYMNLSTTKTTYLKLSNLLIDIGVIL